MAVSRNGLSFVRSCKEQDRHQQIFFFYLRLSTARLLSKRTPRFLHCGMMRWECGVRMFIICVSDESVPNRRIFCMSHPFMSVIQWWFRECYWDHSWCCVILKDVLKEVCKMEKRISPKTGPWGTPQSSLEGDDLESPTRVRGMI